MMFGPLLKTPHKIQALASHADIAPSLISFFKSRYKLKVPEQTAWLGDSFIDTGFVKPSKQIPLFRNNNNIQDFIFEKYYVSSSMVYQMTEYLNLVDAVEAPEEDILKKFRYFKAVNRYVTENNKIIPASNALFVQTTPNFSKSDLIWVESIFNGSNYDNAYETARDLAHHKEWNRALLLCRYILSKIPRHADTEILMGRIYAWKNDFDKSMEILEGSIKKYPEYIDGYSALLDTYFWAGANDKAKNLLDMLQLNNLNDEALTQKIVRAEEQIAMGASLEEIMPPVKEPTRTKEL
jgi:tetratricopeptide (TPR) repeat protein